MKKLISVLLAALLLVAGMNVTVFADVPNRTYTYVFDENVTDAALVEQGFILGKVGDGAEVAKMGEGPDGTACMVIDDDTSGNGPYFTTPPLQTAQNRFTGKIQADFVVYPSVADLDVSLQGGGAIVGSAIVRIRFKAGAGGAGTQGTFAYFGPEPKKVNEIVSDVKYDKNAWCTLRIVADIVENGTASVYLIDDKGGEPQLIAADLPIRRPDANKMDYVDRFTVQAGMGKGTSYVKSITVTQFGTEPAPAEGAPAVSAPNVSEPTVTAPATDKAAGTVILMLDSNIAYVSGKKTNIDVNPSVKPYTENDRTLVPLRFITESLGATVEWDGATEGITIKRGDIVTKMNVGKTAYTVNGVEKTLDVPATVKDDRTVVPLRAVAESIGAQVFWDDRGLIIISESDNTFDAQADSEFINKWVRSF